MNLKPIHVSFRARPLNSREKRAEKSVIKAGGRLKGNDLVVLAPNPNFNALDPQSAARDTGKTYACDTFFNHTSATEDVYTTTVSNLIPRLIDGHNGSAFCYGPTGTGKTFTMFGDEDNPGLVRLVGLDLFDIFTHDDTAYSCRFKLSALEIYGEKLSDLLAPHSKKPLKIVDGKYGTRVTNLTRNEVDSYERFITLVEQCRKARVTESTQANAVSSRSHCIIQVWLEKRNNISGAKKVSKLNLIDLAGSERATVADIKKPRRATVGGHPSITKRRKNKKKLRKRTISNDERRPMVNKARLNECIGINSSLLALKKCIRCLVQKKKFIPWRDSKLTRLLEDTLKSDGSAYMIVCLSKGSAQWQATRDTLEYGTQARMIQVGKKQKKPGASLREQLATARGQNETLFKRLRELEVALKAKTIEVDEKNKTIASQDDIIFSLRAQLAVLSAGNRYPPSSSISDSGEYAEFDEEDSSSISI